MSGQIDFNAINADALQSLPSLVESWFPGGRRLGREYQARNPNRADRSPGSFSINVETGKWSDFATGESGGDPISLAAFRFGVSQVEAARIIAGVAATPTKQTTLSRVEAAKAQKPDWAPILPVPEDAPKLTTADLARFAPEGYTFTKGWRYYDTNGAMLGAAVRCDAGDGAKQVYPLTFCSGPKGERAWRLKQFSEPRPLYGIHRLAANPTKPVLVVEGEKAADAAGQRFPDYVVVTSPGGSKAAAKADWSPLKDRAVTIWPDADKPGQRYANDVAKAIADAGARSVAAVATVAGPHRFPEKWDLADDLPAGVTHDDLRRMLNEASGSVDTPLPLFPPLAKAEPYPIEALASLSPVAEAIERKIQVPAAIAAQAVLAATALAAQAKANVQLPFGQTRPLSLYFVTVAASGDRKSSADNEALLPVRKREKALKEQSEAEMKEWAIASAAHAAEKRKIEADRKLDYEGRRAAFAELGDAPERPLYPFLTAPDPTIEGLLKAWVNAPAALGIFTAEGGQFSGGHGMSQENRLKSAAMFSEIWDGSPVKRIRAGDGVSILYGRRLTMHLMIQPQASLGFLSDPVLRDQGLLSRVLVAAPESISGTRTYRPPEPMDDAAIRSYGARLLSILESEWPLTIGTQNELEPPALALTEDAKSAWIAYFDYVETQIGKADGLRPVADFAAKAAEHAARIAGVLTIFADLNAEKIDADAMANGIQLADWYLREALRLHAASRTDPALLQAQGLLDWMKTLGTDAIEFRDILRLGPSPTRTKNAAEKSIDVLTAHGWLVEISKRPRRLRLIEEARR